MKVLLIEGTMDSGSRHDERARDDQRAAERERDAQLVDRCNE